MSRLVETARILREARARRWSTMRLLAAMGPDIEPTRPPDTRRHLAAARAWLGRAQDANDDGGVSRGYHLRAGWGAWAAKFYIDAARARMATASPTG